MTTVWLKFDTEKTAFSIKKFSGDIDDLKKAIKAENPDLSNVAARNISIYPPPSQPTPSNVLNDTGAFRSSPLVSALGATSEDSPWIVKIEPSALGLGMSRVGSASFLSSNLVTSCISMSINDRCSTGRHVDRNKKCQKKFRNKVLSRDQRCVATGLSGNDLIAAHIMPLDRSELIPRNLLFSAKNGVLLTSQLEDDYDRHMWIFDETGDVRVLFQFWSYRTAVTRVSLSRNDDGPSLDLIRQHNELALAAVKHHCPNCWKYVGEINISNHQSGSCIALNNIDDGNDE